MILYEGTLWIVSGMIHSLLSNEKKRLTSFCVLHLLYSEEWESPLYESLTKDRARVMELASGMHGRE